MTVAVVGDVGARPEHLRAVIKALGGNPDSGEMPRDMEIVQVGDLIRIRRGSERPSLEVVEIVDRVRRRSGHWYQLWGNHDLAALGGDRMPTWTGEVDPDVARMLGDWWREGFCRVAVAVGESLITHAGLTLGAWNVLQSAGAKSPAQVADALNQSLSEPSPGSLGRGGRLTTGTTAVDANCIWAEVCLELTEPWAALGAMPFDQVHGHASVFDHAAGHFWPMTSSLVRSRTRVHQSSRRCVTSIGDRQLTSVDTGLLDERGRVLPVLILEGTVR